jgi:hypothetical protein
MYVFKADAKLHISFPQDSRTLLLEPTMEQQMTSTLTRRLLLKASGLALGARILPLATEASPSSDGRKSIIHLNLNENAFGPSSSVAAAIQGELDRVFRYAESASAPAFAEQVAASERVPVEQIVLGEILGALGLYLGSQGAPAANSCTQRQVISRWLMQPRALEAWVSRFHWIGTTRTIFPP